MVRFPAPDLPPVRRMIHGICSSERVVARSPFDHSVLVAGGCDLTVPLPLLHNHGGAPIGEVNYLQWLAGGKLYCRAVLFYNSVGRRAWEQIAEFKMRGLSCTFKSDRHEIKLQPREGVVKYITKYKIREISVVRAPLNQDCYFAVFSGGAEHAIAGMRSLSEHRRINERARQIIRDAEQMKATARKTTVRRSGDEWMTPAERAKFDAWLRKSKDDDRK
jgi:Caudovirus prohead serine protease